MRAILLLLAGVCSVSILTADKALDLDRTFAEYVKQYNKKYNSVEEYKQRKNIFQQNLLEIEAINAGRETSTQGVNVFTDLTYDEWQNIYIGGYIRSTEVTWPVVDYVPDENLELADSLDWRERQAVSAVKDQGLCGSCWIFSAVECIEGQYAIKHSVPAISLSEQQGVDCGTNSCGGGSPVGYMNTVAQQGGLETEESYPYTSTNGKPSQCQFDPSKVAVKVDNGQQLNVASEDDLAQALQQHGPLSIAIFADFPEFKGYNGSVLIPNNVNDEPDHAVLLVGFGTDPSTSQPYWLIKNSWGEAWGESGYLRLIRGQNAIQILSLISVASVQ